MIDVNFPKLTSLPTGTPVYAEECTMGFIFRGGGNKLYVGTAGHCVEKVGDRMATGDAQTYELTGATDATFGTAVYVDRSRSPSDPINIPYEVEDDFALIAIDAADYNDVRAKVAEIGGPSGYTTPDTAAFGDQLDFYGHGAVEGLVLPHRYGVLIDSTGDTYRAETMAVNHDSGAPILDNGKALGIVSHSSVTQPSSGPLTGIPTIVTDTGPTIQRILKICAQAGYKLSLVTA